MSYITIYGDKMDRFVINGGRKLSGKVNIRGAKNSVLPLIAASVLNEGVTHIKNCPRIKDVYVMAKIIERLGGKFVFSGNTLSLNTENLRSWVLPEDLTGEIRASVFITGALISRFGYAETAKPGGCNIGNRPIDIHICALRALKVAVNEGERVSFNGARAESGKVVLRFPSVGATENAMMASVKLKGFTIIENCAEEPEIIDLQNYLNMLGARVSGAGTKTITVEGVDKLYRGEIEFTPRQDRIEAGTFLLCGACAGGEIEFNGLNKEESLPLCKIIGRNACKIYQKDDKIYNVKFYARKEGFGRVIAEPYPGFPTDLQPQITAAACLPEGLTVTEDRVFPSRFSYATELTKMGADLRVLENVCVISGRRLHGAVVSAGDLRGGAALCLAALGAEGETVVLNVSHIDRGYEDFEVRLRELGADVKRITP